MKDKLYKTHHKTGFYVFKNASITGAVILMLGAAVVLPTYITLQTKTNDTVLAEEKSQEGEIQENKLAEYDSQNTDNVND